MRNLNLSKTLDIKYKPMKELTKIAYDLGLSQSMYKLPDGIIEKLSKEYPVVFELINTPNTPKISKDAEIYWGNRIERSMLFDMPKLKWIHFGSVGVNRINNIENKKLLVTSSKGTVTSAMITNIISLIGIFSRNLDVFFNQENNRPHSRDDFEKYFHSLKNFDELKILIIGLGNIGQSLAKKLSLLGGKVDAITRKKKNLDFINKELNINKPLENLKDYDFIISLLPENKHTINFFDYHFFSNISQNSIFINGGRGKTVIEKDLIRALDENLFRLAILDVLRNEPLTTNSKIYKHPKTFVTPHIFAFSPSYWPLEINLFKKNLSFYLTKSYKKMINLENYK